MKTLKIFFALAAIAIALTPQASAQSALAPVSAADPSIGNKKAGYRMKLSSHGAWPGFAVGVSDAHDKHEVSVFGNRAFVLTQGHIAILDIRDPANPVHTGGFSPGIQWFVTFASDGKHVYGIAGKELEIWDVTDGAHPTKTSSLWLGELNPWPTIRVSGSLLFVAPKYEGSAVKIIDISDPKRPQEMAEYRAAGEISGMAVSGDKLLVASGGSLDVLDISAPASPKLLGSLSHLARSEYLFEIAVAGNIAFVAGYENDGSFNRFFAVVDFSDPKLPVQIAEVPGHGHFYKLKVADGRLYAFAFDKVEVFDLSNLASLTWVGQITIDGFTYAFSGIDVAENKVYAQNPSEGLNIFDVSVPSAPKRLGGAPAPSPGMAGNYSAIALSGSYAYVFNNEWSAREQEAALLVFDVRDPSQPQLAARLPTPKSNWASSLEASGNVLCYGDQESLSLVDITDPKSPKISAELGFNGSIAMEGSLLFVASDSIFRVMDVANPSSPSVRGELRLNALGGDIKVSGTRAFVTSPEGGLRIIDVSNPSAPRLEATYNPSKEVNRLQALLAVSGNYVVISSWHSPDDGASGYTAIDVLDVSDPAHPVLVAMQPIHIPSHGGRMRIAGNRLYIHRRESHMPGYSNFLNVFDISNPKEIFQVAEYGTFSYSGSGQFRDMAANEQFVFLVGSAFEVTRAEFLPFLGARQNGGKMELNWPNVDPAFQLRQASRLGSPAEWISSTLAPATIEGQNYLSLPIEAGANFFRLQKP